MKVCIYGASSNEIKPLYIKKGVQLGEALAEKGWTLVFGGGSTGMMGAFIQGVNKKNGKSIGVAPTFFKKWEALSDSCTEFIYTNTMRERKEKMEQLADGFIVTPGGIGTFEEFFEILTLKLLEQLDKPICLYNIDHSLDPLNTLLIEGVENGFMKEDVLRMYFISDSIEEILSYIAEYQKYYADLDR